MEPTAVTRDTSRRIIDPPCRAWAASSTASISSVTALATSRPPGFRASIAPSSTPASLPPPPMKIASGWSKPSKAAGAAPIITSSPETPKASAFRAIRSALSGCCSMATARSEGWDSIHSMPIEPEPAPISHSNSPRRGAREESVTARISRLVICPSCSNSLSSSPHVKGRIRAPSSATTSIATTFSASISANVKSTALTCRRFSRSPPRASSKMNSDWPKPKSDNNSAIKAGAWASEVSAMIRAPP